MICVDAHDEHKYKAGIEGTVRGEGQEIGNPAQQQNYREHIGFSAHPPKGDKKSCGDHFNLQGPRDGIQVVLYEETVKQEILQLSATLPGRVIAGGREVIGDGLVYVHDPEKAGNEAHHHGRPDAQGPSSQKRTATMDEWGSAII